MGYKVFYDIESLSSGKFNAKLLEVIDECNDVLVILPPNSLERCVNEDDWLRLEVAYAIRQGKNIIPIMMKGFEWGKNIPEDIKELKNYNGVIVTFDFFEGVLARIIKYLTNSSKEKMGDNIKKWRIFLLSLIFAVFLTIRKTAGCFIYDEGSPMFFSVRFLKRYSGEEW